LRLRAFWGLVAIYSLWGAGYTVFITFAVAYLREREWDPAAASGAFAAWGAAYMVAPMIWGSLGDRLGRKLVFALALIVQSVGCLAFITATPIGAFVGAAIVGFGLIGIPTGMSAAAGDYFPPPITGLAFGMLTVTFGLGCIIGPSVGGLLSDVSGTLQSGLLFGLGAVGASLLATALLERPPTAPGPAS
jgi:MFS family permease